MQIVRSSFRKLLGSSRSALAGLGHLSYGATMSNGAIFSNWATLYIVRSSFRKLLGSSRSALAGLGHLSYGATMSNLAILQIVRKGARHGVESDAGQSLFWAFWSMKGALRSTRKSVISR
jgi:hypothetical protein